MPLASIATAGKHWTAVVDYSAGTASVFVEAWPTGHSCGRLFSLSQRRPDIFISWQPSRPNEGRKYRLAGVNLRSGHTPARI